MAITTKRPALVKRASGKVAKTRAGASSAKRAGKAPATTAPAPHHIEPARAHDTVAPPAAAPETAEPATTRSPGAGLVDAQMRTLTDLCEALDKKCLELLEDVAAARTAEAASEPVIAELREAVAQERSLREALERELADIRRAHGRELLHISATHEQDLSDLRERHEKEQAEARLVQTMLERELASLRVGPGRANRAGSGAITGTATDGTDRATAGATSGSSRAIGRAKGGARPNGEHAARLLPLLQKSLGSGSMVAVHDTKRALARFRVAGTIDAIEGTREAPVCRGWLLSRADLQAQPLMFLMDDVGLLDWTEASSERPDVNAAHRNTKLRPGFEAQLSRAPIGQLRGIVAVKEAGSDEAVFFEATTFIVPKR